MIKEEIKKFLTANLFDELGFKDWDDEKKFLILSKLAEVVYLRFINYLAELLPDDVMGKLDEILENNNIEEFQKIINEYAPNYNDVLSEIIAEEKKRLLELKNL